MSRRIVLLAIVCYSHLCAYSQYATTGTGLLKDHIWWFDWAGITIAEGASRTFNTADGLTVTISFSKVSRAVPEPYVISTSNGSLLHQLYNFTDPDIKPALYSADSKDTCSFTMKVIASRSGVAIPFIFIAADAEESIVTEVTTLKTDGSNWQAIDFYRNASQAVNPLTGCNTKTVSINNTYGGATQTGQNPVVGTNAAVGSLAVNVEMNRHAIRGGMAAAFGILSTVDRGDLPASYGTAQHQLWYGVNNGCNYLPPLPAIYQLPTLQLGALPGDADVNQTDDDNTAGTDEDGISSFPVYNGLGSYSVQVALTNKTGSYAWLTGWFDYNRNGVFEISEANTVFIPFNATAATVTWKGLPTYLPPGTKAGYGFRFRLSTNMQATQSATGFAIDGEVEDYFVAAPVLCNIKVTTIQDTTVCAGRPVQLTTIGASQYSWNVNTYFTTPGVASPVAVPQATTTYIVTGSNPQACEAKDTVVITVLPRPGIIMSNDTIICAGAAIQLSANAPDGISFSWSPQAGLNNTVISNPVATPPATTQYVVTVLGSNGCFNKDSVKVIHRPAPAFRVNPRNPTICERQSIVLTASGGDEYTWLSKNNMVIDTSSSIMVQPAASEKYRVRIKERVCQVTDTLTVPVQVNENPVTAVSKSNDIDCANGQAVLHASGGNSYTWNTGPGSGNVNAGTVSPVVAPTQTTTYYVMIANNKGCTAKDSVTVQVDFARTASRYPVPTAFSPNHDGKNDCFSLKYWGRITGLELAVFNKWGERIFTTKDPAACWDGTFKGVAQPTGGYVYQIKATTACGIVYQKGVIMLVR